MRLKTGLIENAWNYAKNYGKPDDGQPLNLSGLILSAILLLTITAVLIHVGLWFVCVFLIGEYKEFGEHCAAYHKQREI